MTRRTTGSATLPSNLEERPTFRVLEPGGRTVSLATFVYDAGRLCFREIPSTRGRLADYYFNDRRRQVSLEVDGLTLRGALTTFWNGQERLWRLQPLS